MDNVYLQAYEDSRRSEVVDWLNCLFPKLDLPVDASDEELRESLADGTVLGGIMRRINAPLHESEGDCECSTEQHNENLKKFLFAVNEMGLPGFNLTEMEQGSISAMVECLLCVKDHFPFVAEDNDSRNAKSFVSEYLSKRAWEFSDNNRLPDANISQENHVGDEDNILLSVEDKKKNFPESDFSDVSFQHLGEKIHELFQLKRGQCPDFSAAEISEMIKSNSFHNASAKSLSNIVNLILDESIEKKNGEVPHRVACLLKKVVQGIEQQISTQAEQIIHLMGLLKSREEKYQLRIRALETLASGTSEESQIANDQLQRIKIEKSTVEEKQKNGEQDFIRLEKEKEKCELTIANLKKEMEQSIESNKLECLDLKDKSKKAEAKLEERLREVELQLVEARKWTKKLEAISESKDQTWKKKECLYLNFIISQSQLLKDLRLVSNSIRKEMIETQDSWGREFFILERKLKELTDAAENYHAVLEENRKLYNEVQDLKGSIRVYCRIRPFLPGQNEKATTIDYLGENGELLIRNFSKSGKDGHRMFKFNKVFGLATSQEEVFLDTRPLIRSVLDGYNVCIFAYGQTGSGKTYTMSGPNASCKEEWGVNYRALNDLFHISRTRRNTIIYEVGVQMVEIYNEVVRDLLANGSSQKRLGIWSTSQPNGLAVPDASMHQVKSTSDVLELMQIGQMNRAVGATALNERSSRSHSILTVHVRGVDLENGATLRGCLHLVDLAGSERVDRSEVTGDRLKEAQHINKSLSALGDVISALAQKHTHVPYRNSKLTQVLQSSLGGQAKTLMFVQINPDVESISETISTLKFAERVSGVELGAARSNKEGKDVRELMEQVASLKDALARKNEEVERLKLLKDVKSQFPNMRSKKLPNNSFRHSSSSPGRPSVGGTIFRGRKLLDGKPMGVLADKAASDPEICSEYSDKQSDTGSLQSMDDFKQLKEVFQPTKLSEGCADVDLLGFGDGDSEERLSDISDSGLSMGTETDGSISSVVEYMLFPEVGKPSEKPQDKTCREKIPSKLPRPPPQKSRQAALARLKYKESPSCSRKSSIGQVASSSRPSKRWQ